MESIIKSATLHPQFAEIDVEYFGGRGGEILKQCICCGQYHLVFLGVCPKTKKIIVEEARRQAEEEKQEREQKRENDQKRVRAKEARRNCLLAGHFNEPWKRPQFRRAIAAAIIPFISIILGFILENFDVVALVGIAVALIWLLFWGWRDVWYQTLVRKKADILYQRVLKGEKVEDG